MKSKKGQQDIIVTILLVLIVLTAIAFVAAFLMKNIKTTTTSADDKQNCLKINVEVASATKGSLAIVTPPTPAVAPTVTVTRPSGDTTGMSDVKLFVNGVACTTAVTTLAVGESKSITLPTGASTCVVSGVLATNAKITAAPVLASGYVCTSSTEYTVA